MALSAMLGLGYRSEGPPLSQSSLIALTAPYERTTRGSSRKWKDSVITVCVLYLSPLCENTNSKCNSPQRGKRWRMKQKRGKKGKLNFSKDWLTSIPCCSHRLSKINIPLVHKHFFSSFILFNFCSRTHIRTDFREKRDHTKTKLKKRFVSCT